MFKSKHFIAASCLLLLAVWAIVHVQSKGGRGGGGGRFSGGSRSSSRSGGSSFRFGSSTSRARFTRATRYAYYRSTGYSYYSYFTTRFGYRYYSYSFRYYGYNYHMYSYNNGWLFMGFYFSSHHHHRFESYARAYPSYSVCFNPLFSGDGNAPLLNLTDITDYDRVLNESYFKTMDPSTNATFGLFLCPYDNGELSGSYCCGEPQAEYCCGYFDSINFDMLWVLMAIPIFVYFIFIKRHTLRRYMQIVGNKVCGFPPPPPIINEADQTVEMVTPYDPSVVPPVLNPDGSVAASDPVYPPPSSPYDVQTKNADLPNPIAPPVDGGYNAAGPYIPPPTAPGIAPYPAPPGIGWASDVSNADSTMPLLGQPSVSPPPGYESPKPNQTWQYDSHAPSSFPDRTQQVAGQQGTQQSGQQGTQDLPPPPSYFDALQRP